MQPDQLWSAALDELRLQMTRATFDQWLRTSTLIRSDDASFVIGVQSEYARDWLENRIAPVITRTLARLTGRDTVALSFQVQGQTAAERPTPAARRGSDASQAGLPPSPAEDSTIDRPTNGNRIAVQRTYSSAAEELLRREMQQSVLDYDVDNFLPVLGPERWALVKVLRRLAREGAETNGHANARTGVRAVQTTLPDLARRLGLKRGDTVGSWLKSEKIPGREKEKLRRIRPVDDRASALARFIPRLKYHYVFDEQKGVPRPAGVTLFIRMDDPLTAADEAQIESVATTVMQQSMEQLSLERSPSEAVQEQAAYWADRLAAMVARLDPAAAGKRRYRTQLAPIVEAAEKALGDDHSTGMLYVVLRALWKAGRLDLFVRALDEALDAGKLDPDANLGAVFVSEIRRIAEETSIDVGLKAKDDS